MVPQIVIDALQQYARYDYYLFLLDPIGQQTDPTKKAREALEALKLKETEQNDFRHSE